MCRDAHLKLTAAFALSHAPQVLQRHLPRPVSLELLPPPKQPAEVAAMSLRERAEYELGQELTALLTHDAAAYPIVREDAGGKEGGKKGSKKGSAAAEAAVMAPAIPLEQFSLDEMQGAALLLEEEVLVVKRAMGHADTPLTEYSEAFEVVNRDMVWLPGQKRYGRAVTATPAERIESVRAEHEAVFSEMKQRARRAAKIEQKVNILVTGLQQRAGKLQGQLGEAWEALGNTQVELECFKALQVRSGLGLAGSPAGVRSCSLCQWRLRGWLVHSQPDALEWHGPAACYTQAGCANKASQLQLASSSGMCTRVVGPCGHLYSTCDMLYLHPFGSACASI